MTERMGDFAISEVSTRKVSLDLFNDKDMCQRWKQQAIVYLAADGTIEKAKESLAVHMRDWYRDTRPLDGDCTVYDTLLGWALTTVDWVEIAGEFVDAILLML